MKKQYSEMKIKFNTKAVASLVLFATGILWGERPVYAQSIVQSLDGGLDKTCAVPAINKDKVPFPFKTANSKFELAEGETYILKGTVVKVDDLSFFNVDLEAQPWLATKRRVQSPMIYIDSDDQQALQKYSKTQETIEVAFVYRKAETAGVFSLKLVATPDLLRVR